MSGGGRVSSDPTEALRDALRVWDEKQALKRQFPLGDRVSWLLAEAALAEAARALLAEVPDQPRPPAAHTLRLDQDGHPEYGWRLSCDHTEDDESWWCLDEPGGKRVPSDAACWLQSWWNALGRELIEDGRRKWPAVPGVAIPVEVEGDGWGDEPRLVPAPPAGCEGEQS